MSDSYYTIQNRPPKSLSREEFETNWKPYGWNLLIIGPTETWRTEWTEWEAIRDIVQNCLDETETYQWGYDNNGLWIRDTGRGISVTDFLLGPKTLKPHYSRGMYGEGMKIAALTLTRLGHGVFIETADKDIWIVYYQQEVPGGYAESLSAIWKTNTLYRQGTTFHIIGYHGSAYPENFAVNVPPEYVISTAPSKLASPVKRYNQLIASPDTNYAGKIYARDIFMEPIRSKYSYNLWSFDLSPDRHKPKSQYELYADIGRTWIMVDKEKLMEEFFTNHQKEFHEKPMDFRVMDIDPRDSNINEAIKLNGYRWLKVFHEIFGPNAVLNSDDKIERDLEYLGVKSVYLPHTVITLFNEILPTGIDTLTANRERLNNVRIVKDHMLNAREATIISVLRELETILDERLLYRILSPGQHREQTLFAADIPQDSERETRGLYEVISDYILIDRSSLRDFKSAVAVLIHEFAHRSDYLRYGKTKDLSVEHVDQIQSVASFVVGLAYTEPEIFSRVKGL